MSGTTTHVLFPRLNFLVEVNNRYGWFTEVYIFEDIYIYIYMTDTMNGCGRQSSNSTCCSIGYTLESIDLASAF